MSDEARRALNFLAGMPAGSTTLDTADVREILLATGGNMLACGRLYNIVTKALGAGIYRLSLEVANP